MTSFLVCSSLQTVRVIWVQAKVADSLTFSPVLQTFECVIEATTSSIRNLSTCEQSGQETEHLVHYIQGNLVTMYTTTPCLREGGGRQCAASRYPHQCEGVGRARKQEAHGDASHSPSLQCGSFYSIESTYVRLYGQWAPHLTELHEG